MLSDNGIFKNGLNKGKNDFGRGNPFINLEDVFNKQSITEVPKGLVNTNDKDLNIYSVEKGDFLFVRSSVKRTGVGLVTAVLNDLPNTVYSGFIIRYRPFKSDYIDPLYGKFLLNSPHMRQEILKRATSSANTNINQDSLSEISLLIPSIQEQRYIANFIENIDKKISLLEEKVGNLKLFKKGLSQNLLPNSLELEPNIRLTGFNDSWKSLKVGDLLIERNIKTPKDDEYLLMAFTANEGVTYKGDKFDREFLVNDEKGKKYKRTELGDFIYSSNNLTTGSIGLNNYGKATISPVYSIFKPTKLTTPLFIDVFINRSRFINRMIKYRQGVVYGQWRIHEKDFLDIKVKVPDIREQLEIVKVFQSIDKKINNVETDLKLMKKYKKGLLQQMFI